MHRREASAIDGRGGFRFALHRTRSLTIERMMRKVFSKTVVVLALAALVAVLVWLFVLPRAQDRDMVPLDEARLRASLAAIGNAGQRFKDVSSVTERLQQLAGILKTSFESQLATPRLGLGVVRRNAVEDKAFVLVAWLQSAPTIDSVKLRCKDVEVTLPLSHAQKTGLLHEATQLYVYFIDFRMTHGSADWQAIEPHLESGELHAVLSMSDGTVSNEESVILLEDKE